MKTDFASLSTPSIYQARNTPIWISLVFLTVIFITTTVIALLNARDIQEDGLKVLQSEEVLNSLAKVINSALDAETGQRGFLITGDNSYLDPYLNARASIEAQLFQLEELGKTNPLQQGLIQELRHDIDVKLAELDETIDLRRVKGFEVARSIVLTDRGNIAMKKIRDETAFIENQTRRQLQERAAHAQQNYGTAIASLVLAGVIGILLSLSFFFLLRRNLRMRAQAQELIRQEREKLEVTLTSIGDAVLVTDSQGNVSFMNSIAEELTGWNNREAFGHPLSEIFHIINESTRKPVDSPVDKVLQTGKIQGLANHTILISRDGSERPIDDSAAPIRSSQGPLYGVVLVFRDISERKKNEAAFKLVTDRSERQKRLYEAVQSSTPDFIYVFDRQHRFTYANNSLLTTWGKTGEEAIGKTCLELGYEPWHAEMHNREIDQVFETGRPIRGEVHFTGTQGKRLYDYIFVPVFGAAGEIEDVAGTTRDITDRYQVEERLRFLDAIGEFTRQSTESEEVMRTTTQMLGEHLQASRCAYADVEEDGNQFSIRHDWTQGIFSITGDYQLDLFGSRAVAELQEGKTLIIHDVDKELNPGDGRDTFNSLGIKAIICCPLVKEDRLVALMAVHQTTPRNWSPAEANLVQSVVDRSWAHIERIRSEEELRNREEFLRKLIDSNQDCVKVLDLDGRLQSINEQGLMQLELENFSLVRDFEWLTFWRGSERDAADRAFREACAGRSGSFEGFCPTSTGKPRWWSVIVTPILDSDGMPESILAVSRNITERKQTELGTRFLANASSSLAELIDRESTLQQVANIAVGDFADWCLVDLIEENGNRRRIATTKNDAKNSIDKEDAPSAKVHEISAIIPFSIVDAPRLIEDISEIDFQLSPQIGDTFKLLLDRNIQSYINIPFISRGTIIGGIAFLSKRNSRRFGKEDLRIAEELTRRITIAIENAQLYKALQDADRRKDEFLATLAHELRNPLAPVRTGLQVLKLAQTPDAAEKAREMMERQLSHMVRLIDDLLDVSRVSRGKIELKREFVELSTIISSAIETSLPLIEGDQHDLSVHLPEESLILDADPTRLSQVFLNLLNNAAKYTPQGGRIELTAEREEGYVIVRVKDSGIGIPHDMLPKIFEMFTQVGRNLERAQGGLGIGLTLVKRLTEMHGGTVIAESDGTGRGSIFIVRLPLATPPSQSIALASSDPATDSTITKGLKILVVDDNVDGAESLSMLLEILDHTTRLAHNGIEALAVTAEFLPQLIFLDIGLPGLNGYEVAQKIRQEPYGTNIVLVALTGWGSEEDRQRSKNAGFDHHLTKPVEAADLERILEEILSNQFTK